MLLGIGEGAQYADGRLDDLLTKQGEEVTLFRVMSEAEYASISEIGGKFVPYEWAMSIKWFATTANHAHEWGKWLYKGDDYKLVEIAILTESLKYMMHVKLLDNIGPAYAADAPLLNKIVRRLKLL